MRHWLVKSEPSSYSWDDLVADGRTGWDGVRNYQARNLMRDGMAVGDRVFFYHSRVQPPEIAGIAEVVREAYPDDTALDPSSPAHDPKATPDDPRWIRVDVAPVAPFDPPITRDELKAVAELEGMELLRRGSRLSVQPVTEEQWRTIVALRPDATPAER